MGNSESVASTRIFSAEIPNSAALDYGAVRIGPDPLHLADHTLTLWEFFKQALEMSGDANFLGTRTRDSSGKAGPYSWISYKQAEVRIGRIATGFQQRLKLKRQDVVGVFSKNRAEWVLTEYACNRMAYILVPLYDTLGPTVVPYIINHTEMRVLVCSNDLVVKALEAKATGCPTLEFVISMEAVTREQIDQANAVGVTLLSLQDVESVPEATVPPSPPTPSDLATICYTSGTTGNPKGVLLTHRNLASSVRQGQIRMPIESHWIHISYLPLSHIMERVSCAGIVRVGAAIGFYQGDVLHLLDDLQELKPQIFLSAPRLYNRVYDKIMHGINNAGSTTKLLFDYAYATKKQNLAHGVKEHSLWDALVFKKIRDV